MILPIKTNKFSTDIDLPSLDIRRQLNNNLAVSVKKEIANEYVRILITLVPSNEITFQNLSILDNIDSSLNIQSVLLNGYQSWIETREFKPNERLAGQN